MMNPNHSVFLSRGRIFNPRLDQFVPDASFSGHQEVEDAKFQHGREDEKITCPQVDVKSSEVGHPRKTRL